MLTKEQIKYWESNLKLADKIVRRRKKGIPTDRWATTEEMDRFVATYELVLTSWLSLFAIHDTETTRSTGSAKAGNDSSADS
jgi:hypothetical protein